MDHPQEDTIEPAPNFAITVYKGCVLPEDYKPIQTITWAHWAQINPDDYSPEQLDLIRLKLLSGKSWVCFTTSLTTICAPEFYRPVLHSRNPVLAKERLV